MRARIVESGIGYGVELVQSKHTHQAFRLNLKVSKKEAQWFVRMFHTALRSHDKEMQEKKRG